MLELSKRQAASDRHRSLVSVSDRRYRSLLLSGSAEHRRTDTSF
jgi:hypothetical protein